MAAGTATGASLVSESDSLPDDVYELPVSLSEAELDVSQDSDDSSSFISNSASAAASAAMSSAAKLSVSVRPTGIHPTRTHAYTLSVVGRLPPPRHSDP